MLYKKFLGVHDDFPRAKTKFKNRSSKFIAMSSLSLCLVHLILAFKVQRDSKCVELLRTENINYSTLPCKAILLLRKHSCSVHIKFMRSCGFQEYFLTG